MNLSQKFLLLTSGVKFIGKLMKHSRSAMAYVLLDTVFNPVI